MLHVQEPSSRGCAVGSGKRKAGATRGSARGQRDRICVERRWNHSDKFPCARQRACSRHAATRGAASGGVPPPCCRKNHPPRCVDRGFKYKGLYLALPGLRTNLLILAAWLASLPDVHNWCSRMLPRLAFYCVCHGVPPWPMVMWASKPGGNNQASVGEVLQLRRRSDASPEISNKGMQQHLWKSLIAAQGRTATIRHTMQCWWAQTGQRTWPY
jgi:hypothetical protein